MKNKSGFTPKNGNILCKMELITTTKGGISLGEAMYNPYVKIVEVADSVKGYEAGDVGLMVAGIVPSPILGLDDEIYFLLKEYDFSGSYAEYPSVDQIQTTLSREFNKKIERDLTMHIGDMAEKAKEAFNKSVKVKTIDPSKAELPS